MAKRSGNLAELLLEPFSAIPEESEEHEQWHKMLVKQSNELIEIAPCSLFPASVLIA
jgi:hypothetical protein